jgi:hypothetical protein
MKSFLPDSAKRIPESIKKRISIPSVKNLASEFMTSKKAVRKVPKKKPLWMLDEKMEEFVSYVHN